MTKLRLFFLFLLISYVVKSQDPIMPAPINMNEVQQVIGYPYAAIQANIEGYVILKILVDENGDYLKHIVLTSPHPILLKAVEEQVSNLKFTPAYQGGKTIKYWLVVPFKFKLADERDPVIVLTNKEELLKELTAISVSVTNYMQISVHLDKEGKYDYHKVLDKGDASLAPKIEKIIKTAKYETDRKIPSYFKVIVIVSYSHSKKMTPEGLKDEVKIDIKM